MCVTVIDSKSRLSGLGAFRCQSPGPEHELVEWFLQHMPFRVPANCSATIFREPYLESGIPDLVVVIWSTAKARRWNSLRAELTKKDVRLMHYLVRQGRPSRLNELKAKFQGGILASLERLEAAEMAQQRRECWIARPLTKTFAVTQILSIEAKVADWNTALDQAFLNTWFASHSFVLLPKVPRGNRLLDAANSRGIGVWTQAEGQLTLPPPAPQQLPRSYASWIFNEWAWRALRSGVSSEST